jgi:hypothetical protein
MRMYYKHVKTFWRLRCIEAIAFRAILYSDCTIVAGTTIVPSRSLPINAVLPRGNKQHLILSTDSVQLNGKLRLGGRTGNNAGWRGAGVWVGRLTFTGLFSCRQLPCMKTEVCSRPTARNRSFAVFVLRLSGIHISVAVTFVVNVWDPLRPGPDLSILPQRNSVTNSAGFCSTRGVGSENTARIPANELRALIDLFAAPGGEDVFTGS